MWMVYVMGWGCCPCEHTLPVVGPGHHPIIAMQVIMWVTVQVPVNKHAPTGCAV